MSLKNFFELSPLAKEIKLHVHPQEFINLILTDENQEAEGVINQYVIDNLPYCFKEYPILYAKIKKLISTKLDIPYESVFLIGSAKTGFSIDPKHYGTLFSRDSDLDFAIVNNKLFEKLKLEANEWMEDYKSGKINPTSYMERIYWNGNLKILSKCESIGFIDENKIPRKSQYPLSMEIGNLMFQIQKNLEDFKYLYVKKSSARIYKDFPSFHSQTLLNIHRVIDNLLK